MCDQDSGQFKFTDKRLSRQLCICDLHRKKNFFVLENFVTKLVVLSVINCYLKLFKLTQVKQKLELLMWLPALVKVILQDRMGWDRPKETRPHIILRLGNSLKVYFHLFAYFLGKQNIVFLKNNEHRNACKSKSAYTLIKHKVTKTK